MGLCGPVELCHNAAVRHGSRLIGIGYLTCGQVSLTDLIEIDGFRSYYAYAIGSNMENWLVNYSIDSPRQNWGVFPEGERKKEIEKREL